MIAFFRLIRFKNLLMIALMQIILHFCFLKYQNIPVALSDFQFILLVISTLSIAGAGYIINNILDQQTDKINKPDNVVVGVTISETQSYNFYIILNILGVGLGFYLSNVVEKPSFAAIFILISITLYFYATNLKQTFIIGNFVASILTSLTIIIVGVFDLYPILNETNKPFLAIVFKLFLDYALFAFIINFIREIIKDIEDITGDNEQGMNTLPIVIGSEKTAKLVFFLSFIPTILLLYYVNEYYFQNRLYWATIFCLAFLIAPMLLFSIKIWSSKTRKDFKNLSGILKLIMFFGVLSIFVTVFNIKHNA